MIIFCFFFLFLFSHFFFFFFFFFNDTATTEIYTLSLHDALPILWASTFVKAKMGRSRSRPSHERRRSEEHTSELQSHSDLVCRLLLEKKKKKKKKKQKKYNNKKQGKIHINAQKIPENTKEESHTN